MKDTIEFGEEMDGEENHVDVEAEFLDVNMCETQPQSETRNKHKTGTFVNQHPTMDLNITTMPCQLGIKNMV